MQKTLDVLPRSWQQAQAAQTRRFSIRSPLRLRCTDPESGCGNSTPRPAHAGHPAAGRLGAGVIEKAIQASDLGINPQNDGKADPSELPAD